MPAAATEAGATTKNNIEPSFYRYACGGHTRFRRRFWLKTEATDMKKEVSPSRLGASACGVPMIVGYAGNILVGDVALKPGGTNELMWALEGLGREK